jgi:hypothetical protein
MPIRFIVSVIRDLGAYLGTTYFISFLGFYPETKISPFICVTFRQGDQIWIPFAFGPNNYATFSPNMTKIDWDSILADFQTFG